MGAATTTKIDTTSDCHYSIRFFRVVILASLGTTFAWESRLSIQTTPKRRRALYTYGSWRSNSALHVASSSSPQHEESPDYSTRSRNNYTYAQHASCFSSCDSTLRHWEEAWGVTQNRDEDRIPCPNSLHSLVQSIVETIHAELSPSPDQVDPNVLYNALQGDKVLGRRPARYPDRDRGRIGIEIEGDEDLKLVALRCAYELCCHNKAPVVVYFNTMNDALMASRYLHIIRANDDDDDNNSAATPELQSLYDLIQIRVLHSSTDLPDNMSYNRKKQQDISDKHTPNRPNGVDASLGYVIIVQPVGPIEGLQRIVARATLHGLPVVLLSPRMNHFTPTPWDQSGFQQSAFYGGCEPPRGPTPWLIRDFTPPILSWIVLPNYSLWQTIRHTYHCWDIFLREEGSLHYLGSTSKVAGRPTRWLLDRLRARSVVARKDD